LKILVPKEGTYHPDITLAAGGVAVANHYLLEALAKYADVYVICHEEGKLKEGIYGISLRRDTASLMKLIHDKYDGILIRFSKDVDMISFLHYIDTPTVVPIHNMRGDSEGVINSVLLWYSVMRDCDAFTVSTNSIVQFYSRFVKDTSCFHNIPLGIDSEQFHPMDKKSAKSEVAQLVNDDRVASRSVVGFLSRFQPEKGAGTYIRVAEMNPQFLFLIVVPTLNVYSRRDLPPNLLYAGRQPRDKLPLFLNAFDLHCFPSVVGEETFGLAVLEAMACGTPPVVPNFDGLPEVVGDAGIIVPAQTFRDEIGSIAGYVSPDDLSDAIRHILADDEERLRLGEKARRRALNFSWDNTAQKLIALFDTLKRRRQQTHRTMNLPVAFVPYINRHIKQTECRAILSNITEQKENLLMWDGYIQTMEEGLALSLLRRHTIHEVEVVLKSVCADNTNVNDILDRVRWFNETIS
jgi:glycosyltransferase involved in cell wall biosynthesis